MAVRDMTWLARWLGGFAVLMLVLQGLATALNSVRGEWGFVVAGATLLAALGVQRLWFSPTLKQAWADLGLGAPIMRGVWTALGVSTLLLCAFPIYALATNSGIGLYPNAAWLMLGILAQAGLAEELVFRGYLYGQLRRGTTFWRAAWLSAIPFAIAHLYTFAIMDWPIALAALALAIVISFPFAHLYELAGKTIWAAALAHAVVQGAIKLLLVEGAFFPVIWMAASAIALWLVFLIKPSSDSPS